MTAIKTRFIQSIIIACFLALASLALTLQVVSAGVEPGAIGATGASAPPASALASGQAVPLQQDPVLVAVKIATLYTDADGDGTPSPGAHREHGDGSLSNTPIIASIPGHASPSPRNLQTWGEVYC